MFPDFNIYSSPLLILVLQGIILSFLLFTKAYLGKNKSFALLGLLLLITCYHRTTYTIGFMGWYDTYRNTKINYYLISLTLAVGPLIYLYIKSCVKKNFELTKKDFWHFIPVLVYILVSICIYLYDSGQPGFDETQNGLFMTNKGKYYWPMMNIISIGQLMLYLAFSIQLYYQYRFHLIHHYSNTYKFELRWLRNFLFIYTFLFLYDTIQTFTDGFIFDLHWTQEWWYHLFAIMAVIYLGVKGYFTSTDDLPNLEYQLLELADNDSNKVVGNQDYKQEILRIRNIMTDNLLFLDPNLNLRILSKKTRLNPSSLSKIINVGAGQNFNDFVNHYRVEYVREQLVSSEYNHLSILSIALDSGFNSKATFNRVFKKHTGHSPSFYRK